MNYTEQLNNLIEQSLSELQCAVAQDGDLSVRKYESITRNKMIGIYNGNSRKYLDAPIVCVEVDTEEEWYEGERIVSEALKKFDLGSFIGSPFK